MAHARRLLLSVSQLQTISSASRHQLRTRRRPTHFSIASRIHASSASSRASRTFTSHVRSRQEDKKDDGAATLPEETATIARAADEPLKPSDGVEKTAKTKPFDDGAATLPEETPIIARAADEPLKPSDAEATSKKTTTPSKLARAARETNVEKPVETSALEKGTETVAGEQAQGSEQHVTAVKQREGMEESVEQDDLYAATMLQHGESEAHRDLREYARLAAWELPLLHKLKKPFEPPTSSTPLRFRYTSYLGDEHPASRKVVVEFKPAELPGLTEKQQIKLIKLAGTRYNPEKQLIKMSHDAFETPAQNKRYLGDLVQKLVAAAKDPKDAFEDVPIDLRHHKQKVVHRFPEEWKIERPARIEEGKQLRGKGQWKQAVLKKMHQRGQIVDGQKVIQEAIAAMPVQRLPRPAAAGQKTVLNARSGKGRPAPKTGW